jgi:hypothetical protein
MLTIVPAGGQTTFAVTFTPGAAEARQTTLRALSSNGSLPIFDIGLTGTGIYATVLTVTSSANPALPGSSVTFTATLSGVPPDGGVPTGSVQFRTNGVASGAAVSLNGLAASLVLATLPHGTNTITAEYAGDGNFLGATNALNPGEVINTPPASGAHFLGAVVDTVLNISASALAGLDYDAEGDPLRLTAVSATSAHGGTVSLSNGTLTYTPPGSYVGADQFTYTLSDGYLGGTATSTANVTVRLGQATSVFNLVTAPVNNTVNLRGYGIPGHSYDIQVSGDLSSWSFLATVTAAPNGVILYTDTQANTSPRYYRFAVH